MLQQTNQKPRLIIQEFAFSSTSHAKPLNIKPAKRSSIQHPLTERKVKTKTKEDGEGQKQLSLKMLKPAASLCEDQFINNLLNLPTIKRKTVRVLTDEIQISPQQQRTANKVIKKCKVDKQFSHRYSLQLSKLKQVKEPSVSQKVLSVNMIKSQTIERIVQKKLVKVPLPGQLMFRRQKSNQCKGFHFTKTNNNHLQRAKKEDIPFELISNKLEQNQKSKQGVMKNKIRFKFDTNMEPNRSRKALINQFQQKQADRIEGWIQDSDLAFLQKFY